jgi:hypothetical protein
MGAIVAQVGQKNLNTCTFCGVLRRQALDRGAVMLGVDHIVTGHNADDIAEIVLMNSTSDFFIHLPLLGVEGSTMFVIAAIEPPCSLRDRILLLPIQILVSWSTEVIILYLY